jgi:hypothetical protein
VRSPMPRCRHSSGRSSTISSARQSAKIEMEQGSASFPRLVVLNACVTKTTAAEILANPATRRRQATMTISLNPLRSTRKSS